MIVFILLAAVGLVLSALAHFSTFFGVDPQTICPGIFFLHLGIFIVFIPAVLVAKRGRKWEEQAPHAPKWLLRLTTVLFFYCLINFAIFMVRGSGGSPQVSATGGYELASHGHFIRAISEEEFHRYRAWEVRGVSGHWMVFYCASLMFLSSAYRERRMPVAPRIAPRLIERETLSLSR